MPEIYVKVHQPPVTIHREWTVPQKLAVLSEAAKPNLTKLRSLLSTWPKLVFSSSSIYPSLTIYTNNMTPEIMNGLVEKLKEQDYVDLVEIIN